jgi:hypothetical protein
MPSHLSRDFDDTGGKFATIVNDTGENFASRVIDIGVPTIPANLTLCKYQSITVNCYRPNSVYIFLQISTRVVVTGSTP